MQKKIIISLIIALGAIAFLAFYKGSSLAQKETIPIEEKVFIEIPEEILVYIPEGTKKTKEEVIFPHKGHKTVDCTVCHHKAYETMAIKDCSVPGCHNNTAVRSGSDSFYAAFHATSNENHRSCLDCHKMLKKEDKATGPTLCKDCHKKE